MPSRLQSGYDKHSLDAVRMSHACHRNRQHLSLFFYQKGLRC